MSGYPIREDKEGWLDMAERDWSVLEVNVKTRNLEQRMNLGDDLAIEVGDINKSFCDQPAKFAWWATVAAQARSLYEHKREEVSRKEDYIRKSLVGQLDAVVRRDLELNGEKVTEAKVEKGIYAHKDYEEACQELYELRDEMLELQENYLMLEAAKTALDQRKDMLISLGAQIRQEGNNADLTIRERANNIVKATRSSK